MKEVLKEMALPLLAMLLAAGIISVLFYLEWTAYFQRFPDADWWTFFF